MTDAWVYMLRCADGSLYTGWSTDVERRLARHRSGKGSRYTASRLPVELVYEAAMYDRSAARREEARIKALDRRAIGRRHFALRHRHPVIGEVRHQQAEGRADAGGRRDDDGADAEMIGFPSRCPAMDLTFVSVSV